MKRIFQTCALVVTGVALSGCNQSNFIDFNTTNSVFTANKNAAYTHVLAERRPVEEAMVTLPASAGTPLEIIQGRSGNGIKQRIVLGGDTTTVGQNRVDVRMVSHRVWPKARKEDMAIHSTKLSALRANMRSDFPGVAMSISSSLSTNPYGPFGYALGQMANGVKCLYGWQNVAGRGREPWGIFTKKSRRPELSLRVRICRSGLSNRELVAIMHRLRIDADPSRIQQPTAVAWKAGHGATVESLQGPSRQGYISQIPAVSYQPEGLPTASEPSVAQKPATKKKGVKHSHARHKTRRVSRKRATPARRSTVARHAHASRKSHVGTVRVPTPLQAKAGTVATATTPTDPVAVGKGPPEKRLRSQFVAPPSTSLIVLPKSDTLTTVLTPKIQSAHGSLVLPKTNENSASSVPRGQAKSPPASAIQSSSKNGLVLPLPTTSMVTQ